MGLGLTSRILPTVSWVPLPGGTDLLSPILTQSESSAKKRLSVQASSPHSDPVMVSYLSLITNKMELWRLTFKRSLPDQWLSCWPPDPAGF